MSGQESSNAEASEEVEAGKARAAELKESLAVLRAWTDVLVSLGGEYGLVEDGEHGAPRNVTPASVDRAEAAWQRASQKAAVTLGELAYELKRLDRITIPEVQRAQYRHVKLKQALEEASDPFPAILVKRA